MSNPLSRRQAMAQLGATMTVSPWLAARTTAEVPTFSFVHLTDLHIMPENRAVEGVRMALQAVAHLPEKPAFVLIGGDIVHAASHAEKKRAERLYDLWQEASAVLALPLYYSVGNGDCLGTAGIHRLAAQDPEYGKRWWQKRLGLSQRFLTFDHRDWRFIILDSVRTDGDLPYYGEIDREQLDWLDGVLRKTDAKQPIVVLTHIPILTAYGLYDDDPALGPGENMIVKNGRAIIEMFQGRAVKAVLQGHTHAVEECLYAGTRYICGGAVCGNWWQGKRFGIHPEGFGIVRVSGDDLTYRYLPYGWKAEVPPGNG
ncbi:MAG: metallophosphoesterase [Capsulimonadales bacterium]|nr:metallophosphoesterase [Capsulimonadales bacterium]